MIWKLFGALFMAAFGVSLCVAQPNSPQSVTNWGESICGVQLSISLSNYVVKAGSTTFFRLRIKNSSTNVVRFIPKPFAPFILTNDSGKAYQLTPVVKPEMLNKIHNPKPNFHLNPGEIRELTEWPLCLKFGKDIDPGDYVFVPRKVDIETPDKQVVTLASNSLQVKIIRRSWFAF